jgi:hypothetical protein
MEDSIVYLMKKLSSKSICERKAAIKALKRHVNSNNAPIASLSLNYVCEHDPSFTVRNLARQALSEQKINAVWEKTHIFG